MAYNGVHYANMSIQPGVTHSGVMVAQGKDTAAHVMGFTEEARTQALIKQGFPFNAADAKRVYIPVYRPGKNGKG